MSFTKAAKPKAPPPLPPKEPTKHPRLLSKPEGSENRTAPNLGDTSSGSSIPSTPSSLTSLGETGTKSKALINPWSEEAKLDIDFLKPELGPEWEILERRLLSLAPSDLWSLQNRFGCLAGCSKVLINLTLSSHMNDIILDAIRADWKDLIAKDSSKMSFSESTSLPGVPEFWRQPASVITQPIDWFDEPREVYIKYSYFVRRPEDVYQPKPRGAKQKTRLYAEYLEEIKSMVQAVRRESGVKAAVKSIGSQQTHFERPDSLELTLKAASEGLPMEIPEVPVKRGPPSHLRRTIIEVRRAGEPVDAQRREEKTLAEIELEEPEKQRWKVVEKKEGKKVVKQKVVTLSAPTLKKIALKMKGNTEVKTLSLKKDHSEA